MDKIRANVYFNNIKTGELAKTSQGYEFKYDKNFLESENSFPIAYNFPLTAQAYVSEQLFPFFEGLVSEGWLLGVQSRTQRIDEKDYFSLLLQNGEDLIGGIRVVQSRS